jgi:hypothetical protein
MVIPIWPEWPDPAQIGSVKEASHPDGRLAARKIADESANGQRSIEA